MLKKIKIKGRLFGGLGNQLFIYATLRSLALKNNAELYIDIQSGFNEDIKYKRKYELEIFNPSFIELAPIPKIKRRLLKIANLFLPYNKKNYIVETDMSYDKRLTELNYTKNTFFEGYWQSYLYFEDFSEVIKSELKKPLQKIIESHSYLPSISESNSVAIHLRFFDQYESNSDANLYYKYYEIAINEIISSNARPTFYIFSDNISRAKDIINNIINNHEVHFVDNVGDDPIIDLALMSSCKHFIIANSSFSWWGAWLGEYEKKQVFTPSKKISSTVGSWSFDGLIPPDWKIIE